MSEKENNKYSKKITLISTSILIFLTLNIFAFFCFGFYKYLFNPKNILDIQNTTYIQVQKNTNEFQSIQLDTPNEPKTEESPLNGQLFKKDEMSTLMQKRPVAVMISNHADARPVSGLSSADLVIESLVEWGITRNVAFFWSKTPEKVGSVRSTRQYFLEWVSPYDPLYIHVGCASTNNPRTNACDHLFSYNVKDVSYFGSWRSNDGGRIAPHNAYSSVAYAIEFGEDRGWTAFPDNLESWKYKHDLDISKRGNGYRYEIIFHKSLNNRGLYNTIWEYDPLTNSYKRWIGGQMDIDQENGSQVTAKNVVVQKINMVSAYDDKGRIIQDTIGEGDAIILMDGEEIYGKWEKTNRMDRTTYYDNSGDEIQFNRGKIWVAAIPKTVGEFEIIKK
jgi:hypothetical protein